MNNIIKGIHTGDIHFDIKNYNQMDQYGYPLRLAAGLHAFDQLVDYAENNNIDFVTIAGDIFHTPKPSTLALLEFARRLKRLSDICTVYILPGNHDQTAIKGAVNSLDLFKEVFESRDVIVVNRNKWLVNTTKSGKTLIVHFLSWLSTIKERRAYLKETTEDLEFQTANKKYPQILMAHGVCTGAKTGFGFDVDAFHSRDDDYYTIKELTISEPQYVALAHIHKYQVLQDNPPILYSGSLYDCDFGEANFDKGFVTLELSSSNPSAPATHSFVVTQQKQKFTSITIKDQADISKKLKKLTDEARTGIVRFVSSGETVSEEAIKEEVPNIQQILIKYDQPVTEESIASRIRDENFSATGSIEDAFKRHFAEHPQKDSILLGLKGILQESHLE
jgi:exonuclease SbcD